MSFVARTSKARSSIPVGGHAPCTIFVHMNHSSFLCAHADPVRVATRMRVYARALSLSALILPTSIGATLASHRLGC